MFHLLKNVQSLETRLPLLSYCTNVPLYRTSQHKYRPLTGIFGNYQPYQEEKHDELHVDNSAQPFSYQLVKQAFRQRGHQFSQLDPLSQSKLISATDRIKEDGFIKQLSLVLGIDLQKFLEEPATGTVDKHSFLLSLLNTYSGHLGFEFDYLNQKEIAWFEKYLENNFQQQGAQFNIGTPNETELEKKKEFLAKRLLQTEALDHFLARKFPSVKRYGCEGAETMVTFVEELIEQLQTRQDYESVDELVIGMPHRGRLNLMVNMLDYPIEGLFHKLSGKSEFDIENEPGRSVLIGDVLSHLFNTTEFPTNRSKMLEATLLPNPSHLEVVSPVICGYARGKLLCDKRGPYADKQSKEYSVVPLQIHGDASFSGQGIIMETLAMANVEHYSVGGSIHLIVNNQVGYTTPGRMHQARSSAYCSDPVKLVNVPVIHVNGDHPEAVCFAAQLALAYRQQFLKDIAVNLFCFRRWGHNELDDPTFTNPQMYKQIGARKSIPRTFADSLEMSEQKVKEIVKEYNDKLSVALANSTEYQPPKLPALTSKPNSPWIDIQWPSSTSVSKWKTSVPSDVLKHVCEVSTTCPPNWNLHSTLKRVFADRSTKVNSMAGFDWATAESLAFGSLLYQGHNIRISGQDVGRGTFSQRHVMIVDQENNDTYVPLNNLSNTDTKQLSWESPEKSEFGQLEICNSILSEEAVMAYEYGLSVTTPNILTIWEAQFGDFFNGAQSIIDTLISSGEAKWLLQSSLTMLLPHGYDGAGPEHTSARLERFLQQSNSSEYDVDSDNVNWSVTYPTTPAQYFHLLRRQMIRPYRKPLVVMAPKMLLRHPRCVSTLDELSDDKGHFAPVLDDPKYLLPTGSQYSFMLVQRPTIESVRSIVFCTGKHYYTLEKEREERNKDNSIAIVRIEELCPFPVQELYQIIQRYPNAKNFVWSQEEQRNMGAWTFVQTRFANLLKQTLNYAGRGHLEAPAVGISVKHQQEVKQIVEDTFLLCKS